MTLPSRLSLLFVAATVPCGIARADGPSSGAPTSPAASAPAASAPGANGATAAADPVSERVQAIKEASTLLEKAGDARKRGNKSFAEQLFSSAEIIVGPEALASISSLFREGAPPRITTPTVTLPKDSAPQPAVAGSSDEDEPDAKPRKGSLRGTMAIEGTGSEGAFGVVTLEPVGGKFHKRPPRHRTMEQRDRQFAPRVLVVPVGSTVLFPNFDNVYHNVFSNSESKAFDLGLYKNGQAREMTFDKEGIVSLGCNLHANMGAHIVVVAAPHYVITDAKGRFSFASLEPGTYKLRAWSEKSLQPITQEVVIKPEQNTVSVKVKGDAPSGPSPDKFGVARGKKS